MPATQLTCFACGKTYDPNQLVGLCDCGKPLRVDYDLSQVEKRETRNEIRKDLWQWEEVLPVQEGFEPKSLGEGGTPLIGVGRSAWGVGEGGALWIKDEGLNPTGSFKARGMAMAVYMAARLGATKLAVPSAGNAGGALAAYAALYGLEAHVFMPKDVPAANRLECELYGAKVTLVDGLITDCAKLVLEGKEKEGWFDVSTLKEPYRIEGKKTMGYEIVAQLGWKYPDAILYPTGGGTGLIGMWKAFEEMEALGWVSGKRPRMYSVQAEGCAPIVHAFDKGERFAEEVIGAETVAAGLRVPRALGDFMILDILGESGGGAVAIADAELMSAAWELSSQTGISVCPEGGACLAAYRKLCESGVIQEHENVVLFNTGTGLKYAEAFARHPRKPPRNVRGFLAKPSELLSEMPMIRS